LVALFTDDFEASLCGKLSEIEKLVFHVLVWCAHTYVECGSFHIASKNAFALSMTAFDGATTGRSPLSSMSASSKFLNPIKCMYIATMTGERAPASPVQKTCAGRFL
jgi:hypothetical protein